MKISKRLLGASLVVIGLGLSAWLWSRWQTSHSVVGSRTYRLEAGERNQWEAYGGQWNIANGAIHSNSNERGAKLMTGSNRWRNYTVESDIRFDGGSADMGIILRSSDESEGVDSFSGYYVGLRSLDETLVIGRANYGWVEARPVPMSGGVRPSVWYRLRVTAYGCNIAASAQNLETRQTAYIAFEERSCMETGRIGVRSLNAQGLWRNISVSAAGWRDWQQLRRNAASVEQPVILDGPPWWTPVHVTVLFVGGLVLALLLQLSYFRVQQWKAYTITQERDRLAHEIHDTMAQSFAGIGYQIQGIRSTLLRGDREDLQHIPDQLTVAYQLVRRCHEDASKTIAMLGSSSPLIQDNLLGELTGTAERIAGEQIKTVTTLRGHPIPLNLRLVDALLHIGQEAIANAVTHSGLTVLAITLTFEENVVELVIQDNGHGFEYTSETEGFGILGMQKRARGVAAEIELVSSPGTGTTVRVRAALEAKRLRRWLSGSLGKGL